MVPREILMLFIVQEVKSTDHAFFANSQDQTISTMLRSYWAHLVAKSWVSF